MGILDKMERKFGRYAIKNLTLYIIITYAIGLMVSSLAPKILTFLLLEPSLIMQGEVWRLISWIFFSPRQLNVWTLIMLFCYYTIGRQLEFQWGNFRYNVYVFGGVILTIISAFVLYFVARPSAPFFMFGEAFSTYYICVSLFFGYAMTEPERKVLLYFIVPIKSKWMALVFAAMIALDLFKGNWTTRMSIIAAALNLVLYFKLTRGFKALGARRVQRPVMKRTATIVPMNNQVTEDAPRHRCAICGRTEKDGEDLEFRYCSKCEGNYEYCQDHLFTHEHVKKGEEE